MATVLHVQLQCVGAIHRKFNASCGFSTLAVACRLLCALLKLVQIGYMCPPPELWHLDLGPQLRAYAQGLKPAEGGTLGAVALTLRLWLMAKTLQQPEPPTAESRLQRIRLAQQAYGLLTAPASRAAIVRQLQQLSAEQPQGQLLFEIQQLQVACLHVLLGAATWNGGPASQQERGRRGMHPDLGAALRAVAAAFTQVEPDSPACILAAMDARAESQDVSPEADVQQLLRGVRLARAQRSDYWAAKLGSKAVHLAVCGARANCVLRETVCGALQAFQQAEAAFARCRRLLPHVWVQRLQMDLSTARALLPAGEAAVRQAGSHGASTASAIAPMPTAAWDAAVAAATAVVQSQNPEEISRCAGCGKKAVGLRACARCRSVYYCSRECHSAGWPQHKHECRPA